MQSPLQNGPERGGVLVPTKSAAAPKPATSGATHSPQRAARTRPESVTPVTSPEYLPRSRSSGVPTGPAASGNTAGSSIPVEPCGPNSTITGPSVRVQEPCFRPSLTSPRAECPEPSGSPPHGLCRQCPTFSRPAGPSDTSGAVFDRFPQRATSHEADVDRRYPQVSRPPSAKAPLTTQPEERLAR